VTEEGAEQASEEPAGDEAAATNPEATQEGAKQASEEAAGDEAATRAYASVASSSPTGAASRSFITSCSCCSNSAAKAAPWVLYACHESGIPAESRSGLVMVWGSEIDGCDVACTKSAGNRHDDLRHTWQYADVSGLHLTVYGT
jgi:hypothetical protein